MFTYFVFTLLRKHREKVFTKNVPEVPEKKKGLSGIRGWLIPFAILMVAWGVLWAIALIGYPLNFITGFESYLHGGIDIGNVAHLPLIAYELISFATVALLMLYTVSLFFKKKKQFPFYFTLASFLALMFGVLDILIPTLVLGVDFENFSSLSDGWLTTFLYIAYVTTSVRVSNTFVND